MTTETCESTSSLIREWWPHSCDQILEVLGHLREGLTEKGRKQDCPVHLGFGGRKVYWRVMPGDGDDRERFGSGG